ncbi:MAG: hypothetical protein A3D10_00100 [Omnitrophica WOR_2 bacterium RIFCSPHIGHO2_02_FULL_48_11]|nr:MAG: hypothetical protein A3D10_00100 [Omnitrophica WOR_2 bacterium RIFCSPHIGHO2_02_FULL_48_11]
MEDFSYYIRKLTEDTSYKLKSGVFGYRILGMYFTPLFTLRSSGIEYKNEFIPWSRVERVRIPHDYVDDDGNPMRYLIIHFPGKRILKVRNFVVQREDGGSILSWLFPGRQAFDFLVSVVKNSVKCPVFEGQEHIKTWIGVIVIALAIIVFLILSICYFMRQ